MRIDIHPKLDFRHVLLKPKRSSIQSRKEVILERTYQFRSGFTWHGLGIIASNMDTTGTFAMAKSLSQFGAMVALHKYYSANDLVAFYEQNPDLSSNVFYSLGIQQQDYDKLNDFLQLYRTSEPRFLCLDVANGYTEHFVHHLRCLREKFPSAVIMAGNVVTPNMVEELVLSGADIVKIGLGSGFVCRTRDKTGVGYPQLSAIIECADAAHGLDAFICSDGGIRSAGDLAKAFAAGADFVMIGSLFAGTDECEGGWWKDADGRCYMDFYGMASDVAMEKYNNHAPYRASEGDCVPVKAKGPVAGVMRDLLGGLRSCCSYCGARKLEHLPKCATFIRVCS